MSAIATCTDIGAYRDALTYGVKYRILEYNDSRHQIKIQDDNRRVRWFPATLFDLTGNDVARIDRWHTDSPLDVGTDDWVEVTITLENGTRRWCSFVTPRYLENLLDQPHADAGIWSRHMVVVKIIDVDHIERALRQIEQQGELLTVTHELTPNDDGAPPP